MSEIRTILHYKDKSVRKNVKDAKYKEKVKDCKDSSRVCWSCGPFGTTGRHQTLANRKGMNCKNKKVENSHSNGPPDTGTSL